MKNLYPSMNSFRLFLLSIFLLIIAGCNNGMEPPYHLGNESINALQFGFAVQDEGWIYYTNQDNRIARTNGNETKTYENTYGRGLNAYGDYIYFLPLASGFNGKTGVYSVHKENSNQIEQVVKDTHISNLIIVNDSLYYSRFGETNSGLYRSNLDGQEEKSLLEATINGLQFYDGWFYTLISSGGSILKISPNGNEVGKLETEDEFKLSTTKFIINNDWIYFENLSDDFDIHYKSEIPPNGFNNIYRMKLDGSNLEQVSKGSLALVDNGANIYYMDQEENQDDENQLIRMNIETRELTVLYKGEHFFEWGNKIGNNLFFIDWGSNPKDTTVIYNSKLNGDKLDVFIE